jgi:hypothetical protein
LLSGCEIRLKNESDGDFDKVRLQIFASLVFASPVFRSTAALFNWLSAHDSKPREKYAPRQEM